MMIVESTYRKLGTAPPISVTQKSQAEKYKVFFSGLQKKRTLFCTTLLVDVTKIVLLWQLLDQQKLCQLFLLALKRGRLIFLTSFQGSHLDVYKRKRKSLSCTLILNFVHVTQITIFVIMKMF